MGHLFSSEPAVRAGVAVLAMGLAAAAALPGCGPPQARPLIAQGRWAEACRAVHPADPLVPTEVRDLERWEFDDLVAERAAARMGVQIVPRHVVEQMLGGSAGLRASPRQAQGMFDREVLLSLQARAFVADRLLLLWRVESAGPIHAELRPPQLARRLGSGPPSSAARQETFENSAALARSLGFQRSPGPCDNSLLTLFERSVDRLRGSPFDVVCSPTEGRTPTPAEQAIVDSAAARILHRCPAGGAACTSYGFFAPFEMSEADVLVVDVTYPVTADCAASTLHYLPIPLSKARDADAPLRALFPKGPLSPKELAVLEKAEPAARPAPATAVASTGDRCRGSDDCRLRGRCHEQAGHCWVAADADCRASELCEVEGWCSVLPGTIAVGDAFTDSLCGARTDADCASSVACRSGGHCRAEGGLCVTRSAEDCRASEACTRFGLCSFGGGACRVTSDADCRDAAICKDWHACRAEAGLCR